MAETIRKKSFTVHSEARTLISKIIKKCDEEANKNFLNYSLKQATKRAADYCEKSEGLIMKIRKETKIAKERGLEERLTTPGKRRNTRLGDRKVFVDDLDKCVIRKTVQDYYMTHSVVPTVKKLLPIIKGKMHFPWTENSLVRVLKSIGFKWSKCRSKRKILIEKPDIVTWRYKYLVRIRDLRLSGRPIFYLDETWLDGDKQFLQSEENFGVQDNSTGNRLILLHAGSESGFLNGAMVLYEAGSCTGDYHKQMNQVFDSWVKEKLVPNLPPKSVVVLDNAPYHSVLVEKIPTKYSLKRDMVAFLKSKGVDCSDNSRKHELIPLVEYHKPKEKHFKVDQYIMGFGHTVVRLPPYMNDLNTIEYAWTQVKSYVRERICDGNLSFERLRTLTEEAVESVTPSNWTGYCRIVEETEKRYWLNDSIVSDTIDNIIITIGEGSENDSDSSDSETTSDYGCGSDSDEDDPTPQPFEK